MSLIYCGIGSRETPQDVITIMEGLGKALAERGHTLRSGAQPKGADGAFERGCDSVGGNKEIYLPWPGAFRRSNTEPGIKTHSSQEAMDLAEKYHPNWAACSRDARLFHARNGHIALGWFLDKPADLCICWTPNASASGGTGQAIRICEAYNIPVFDLADPESFDKLDNFPGI